MACSARISPPELHVCTLRPNVRPSLRPSLAVACLHGPGMACSAHIHPPELHGSFLRFDVRPTLRPATRPSLAVAAPACMSLAWPAPPGMACTSTILLSYSWIPCACMFTCPQCCAQAPRCPHGLRCPVHACTFTRQVHVPHCPHSLGCPVRAGIHPHSCLHSF